MRGFTWMAGREAVSFVHCFAPGSVAGQQQIGNYLPAIQIFQPRLGKPLQFPQQRDLGRDLFIETGVQPLQSRQNQRLQRFFQRRAHSVEIRIHARVPQPLVALFQHLHDQPLSRGEIVIQMEQQIRQRFVLPFDMTQRVLRRLAIQVLGFFRDVGHCAEAGEPRHPACDSPA